MRRFSVPGPLDLLTSLRPLVHSAQDPTIRLRATGVARCTRTPDGPGTIEVTRAGDDGFVARAWGPGAAWLLDRAPALIGADDDRTGFRPELHPHVARAAHRRPGLRLGRTGVAWDGLVPTILAQRVTSIEAARSWTRLVRAHGEAAPGPYDLRLHPAPDVLAALPYWAYHRFGVERHRAEAIVAAARSAERIQAALTRPGHAAGETICGIRGLGPWTAALVLRIATGDPDQVEVGDFHVKNQVAWALAGEPRATDERMLELLAPFAGHRGRVVRLLLATGVRAPTYGARQRIVAIERL
ncbi:DNA-3-methyladenine glycosylase family protein [Egicoccus halophilus]|uniref:DNA-3-methyladenine glycosylase II n=1 Tax=Egicoccus halophilus TaxID=1670830 RepID=A0A8J3ADJ6_9ACTN|nr:DNA-3-methyladenine glycosylase 2 family protein [Egicoccus halophilus]GGI09575.1 3-methyladenine DNA glycosylase [Egicoccus halophilus]